MFRNGLRRCATQARTAATAGLLVQSRAALPTARLQILPVHYSIAPLNRIAAFTRAYSSEAVAEETTETSAAQAPEEIRKFTQLEGIDSSLIQAIVGDFNYDEMTPVQAKTINPALKGTDIVAQAKTGTGKTLAFLLPLLQRMLNEDPSLARKGSKFSARSDDIRGIVLSPTRELAEQIAVEARKLTQHTGLVVQTAVGGTDKRAMLHATRRHGCHLLVATPGRLNDLLQDPRSGIDAPNLAALVLDEADRMLDVGFERELMEITKCLPSPEEKVRQTMLVSATIPDNVIRLARSMVRADDFEFVQTIPENESLTHDKVPQHIVPVSGWTNVFPALWELIEREAAKARAETEGRPFKAIVYLNTTALVELAGEMGFQRQRNKSGGPPIHTYVMQSRLTQAQRQRAADLFRSAKSGILFSSDVTARGMDFPDVTHVIQIDAPRDRESYIHRLGRTGRQNKEGEGYILIPHSSIHHARKLLKGLPIKQNNTIAAAEVDIPGGETTQHHQDIKDLFAIMPRRVMVSTYTSMFGLATDKATLAEDINEWTQHGWGWPQPPAVSSDWVRKIGLGRVQGMNISEQFEREPRERHETGDFGRRPQRQSSDPFDAMSRGARRDGFSSGNRGGNSWGGSNNYSRNNYNRGGSSFNRGGSRHGRGGDYGRGGDSF